MTLEARPLPEGALVYDCYSPLSSAVLDQLEAEGAMPSAFGRYSSNFSYDERQAIVSRGAGYFLIHTARMPYKWTPTAEMGKADGQDLVYAAANDPKEMCCCLDFETPAFGTTDDQQVDYLNTGFEIIAAAGFTATLYEGYGNRLSAMALYQRLICKAYWKSASLVVPVAVRGYRLVQERVNQTIGGHLFDVSHGRIDDRGGAFMAAFDVASPSA